MGQKYPAKKHRIPDHSHLPFGGYLHMEHPITPHYIAIKLLVHSLSLDWSKGNSRRILYFMVKAMVSGEDFPLNQSMDPIKSWFPISNKACEVYCTARRSACVLGCADCDCRLQLRYQHAQYIFLCQNVWIHTLHYITFHYITLHYIKLRTLHYITFDKTRKDEIR